MSSKVLNRCVESIYLNTSSKIEVFSLYEASVRLYIYDQASIR